MSRYPLLLGSNSHLKTKIKPYENSRSVQLCRSNFRSLKAAKKRVPRKVERAKKDLVYYHISQSCVFGGKSITIKGVERDLVKSNKYTTIILSSVCACACMHVCEAQHACHHRCSL